MHMILQPHYVDIRIINLSHYDEYIKILNDMHKSLDNVIIEQIDKYTMRVSPINPIKNWYTAIYKLSLLCSVII